MGKFITQIFKKRKLQKQWLINSVSRRKSKDRPIFSDSILIQVISILVIWGVSLFCEIYKVQHYAYTLIENQLAPETITARVEFEYEDSNKTRFLQAEESLKAPRHLTLKNSRTKENLSRFDKLLTELTKLPEHTQGDSLLKDLRVDEIALLATLFDSEEKKNRLIETVQEQLNLGIHSDKTKSYILAGASPEYEIHIEGDQPYERRIEKNDILTKQAAINEIYSKLMKYDTSETSSSGLALKIFSKLLNPNLIINNSATVESQDRYINTIKPAMQLVKKGEMIIHLGAKVTTNDLTKIKAYEEKLKKNSEDSSVSKRIKFMILSLLCIMTAFIFSFSSYTKLSRRPKMIILFTLLVATNLLLNFYTAKLFMAFVSVSDYVWGSSLFAYSLVPFALAAILATLLIDLPTGFLAGILVAILSGMVASMSIIPLLIGIITSIVCSVVVRFTQRRSTLIKGCLVSAILTFMVIAPLLLDQGLSMISLRDIGILSLIGFILLSSLVSLMLPPLEYAFGRTTNISLLELCDLNHPLLQKLQLEAPGSYHHSLLVATVAEHAAKAIGANPLLTRVCAYFHDIGKTAKSEYFTENNFDSSSKHNELRPKMSSLVIMNHVKEGVNLALKYKLKGPILEAIEQHHGKSLVSFFYQLAKSEGGEDIDINDAEYRYPGPLPRRKEIVIIAIADACEAASRSLDKPTHSNIEALVDELVKQRVNDNQFIEADITLRELDIIKKSIATTLANMLHSRIKYPKEEENADDSSQAGRKTPAE